MRPLKLQTLCILLLLGLFFFPKNSYAQQDKDAKKKIVIVKKKVDKDGNETIEKIIKEGAEAEAFDVEEYIQVEDSDAKSVDVEVEVTLDEKKDMKKGKEKTVEVTVDGEDVIIMEGGEKTVLKIDGDLDKEEIKTKDGKHIIIMKEDVEDKDVKVMLEEMNIDIDELIEGGEKEIRIVKTRKRNGAFFGVMIDPSAEGMELLDVVKDSPAEKIGLKRGDLLRTINEHDITDYDKLVNVLSQHKPGDSIVVTYKSEGEIKKANVVLADSKDVPSEEKMIWKTDDGKEIELKEHNEFHFEGEGNDKKKIKKRIIIKKEKDN